MARQFTLGKNERLKSRKQIEQLFTGGKNFHFAPFRVFYYSSPFIDQHSLSILQFGVGVSGKNFKRAVDRNRIKRLTREVYRLQKQELQTALKQKKLHLNIFIIYTGKEMPEFNIIREKLNVILNKLIKIIHETISPDT